VAQPINDVPSTDQDKARGEQAEMNGMVSS
jgi:hypothetical protein